MDILRVLKNGYKTNNLLDVQLATRALFTNGDLNMVDADRRSAAMIASYHGDHELLKKLIDTGADIHIESTRENTALHMAADAGYVKVVDLLLKQGADVYGRNVDDHEPLTFACINGHLEVAKLLANAGGNPFLQDSNGQYPILWAFEYGHFGVVESMLQNRNIDTRQEDGSTFLMHVSRRSSGHLIIPLLLSLGAAINTEDHGGWTPLIYASNYACTENVEALLEFGADLSLVDGQGYSAFDHAEYSNHHDVIEVIKIHNSMQTKSV